MWWAERGDRVAKALDWGSSALLQSAWVTLDESRQPALPQVPLGKSPADAELL